MSRKKKYIPKDYESLKGEGDTSANIYSSMQMSAPWKSLTPRCKVLYLAMKDTVYRTARHDKDRFDEVYRNDNRFFTFNESKWIKGNPDGFELYSDRRAFYQDVALLIEHGFIDCVESGESTRTKSLYRFSERWRVWGTPSFSVPEKYKTMAMRGTRKRSRTERAEDRKETKHAERKEESGLQGNL